MGKKKAQKKADDDWENELGESVAPSGDATAGRATETGDAAVEANGKGASLTGNSAPVGNDDDEDFGGLMSTIKKGAAKGSKKNKKKQNEVNWDELGEEAEQLGPDAPNQVIAQEKTEEEGQKADAKESNDKPEAGEETDGDTPRILTKKEKEKLKKEKEKAKKKAQAAAKKANAGNSAEPDDASSPSKEAGVASGSEPASAPAANDDEDDDDEAEGDGASAEKKKKKKKKKAAEAQPAPASGKKPSAAVLALRAQIEARRKAEEEARAVEEAERKRLEEIERQEREEEECKEAERQRKKEKERLKREQLKKEGKLLTPKQKAEKQAAEARMKAMIQSGQITVEGLKDAEGGAETKRKVVYDNRKKKKSPADTSKQTAQQNAHTAAKEQPEQDKKAESVLEPVVPVAIEATGSTEAEWKQQEGAEEDVKDSWDAESDDEVKDDWAAESDDDAQAAASTKPIGCSAQSNGKAFASASARQSDANPSTGAKGKAPAATKQSEDEGSDSDSEATDSDSHDSDDDDSSDEDEDEGMTAIQRQAAQKKQEAAERRKARTEEALAARSKDNLRSPICCILGHVDTGKTKLLDKIRQTNVQEGEAGGITQQIGATYFPVENIKQKTAVIDPEGQFDYKIPGLLVIDTPGHESFTNLRTRGSSLCNIAILVVDIMHGLEPQTLESIRLLRDRKTPFIVALNKIDRLYGWDATPNGGFRASLAKQNRSTQQEFEDRVAKTIVAFAEQGLNAVLYYENKNFSRNVSLVPTSAHTGEGIPDMLQLIVNLTQNRMSESLMYLSELECTVLEVKVIEGLGTTIDVVLSNGVLREGNKIVVCGLNGPIVTQVRALLTPQPLKEMRVKGAYVHHKEVKAALGVKITAPDLEKAIAGSRLLVCGEDDDEEDLKDEVMSDLTSLLNSIDKSGKGVCVQASTLGSLEALLEFLRVSKIPVSGINIGPVYKRDVMRCATMLERAKEFACMLCFDVDVDKDAAKLAEELGIRVFKADIIYHLFDAFTAYNAEMVEAKKREAAPVAVWPCRLKTIAAFAKRDPIILGCDIIEGSLRVGTPLCVVKVDPETKKKAIINIGRVTSLEINHRTKDIVLKSEVGGGVAVKIETSLNETSKLFGRHFDEKDELLSHISRSSIDALKDNFWDGISTDEKKLIKKLKGVLDIP
ncbi:hypothetical protein K437DRAFT_254676 [Tilletiaria anomala UBC 951]|uniref:Eukaryotic translation initiation factor 5B n=1 Tax=Tilletiaria anomala (strain ATCC 24038 / CBS 436.72 / UBC 951) TaxID=1037660 RepID=A0A066WNB1_TILAU|nr:uncharacterized protein K437DRAFT_254676 [Tilletiaria anomala UBC 951]KDN52115.1 hypothetical protein K437DRAFT_254676 [Tilletiaria anomala UBC 951]